MKKIAIAAALLIGTAVASQAAPAKSPYCKMANSQRNPVAWNAYYGCLQTSGAARAHAAAPARHREAKNPYCKFASAQRNVVAWNAYYHCLNR